jgi:hypothetical protein
VFLNDLVGAKQGSRGHVIGQRGVAEGVAHDVDELMVMRLASCHITP